MVSVRIQRSLLGCIGWNVCFMEAHILQGMSAVYRSMYEYDENCLYLKRIALAAYLFFFGVTGLKCKAHFKTRILEILRN